MSDRTGLRLARARRRIALAALSFLTIVTAAEPGWPHDLPSFKGARETIDELNTSAKGATERLTRLGGPSSMVTGHTLCPVSANGGPDCKLASDQLCRAKGFKEGKSLAIDAVEKCSPKVLIPGRARKPDDCRTENFVTRAMCQ